MADEEEEERIFNIPLRKSQHVPRTKRAPRAIKEIRDYVVRHMKAKREDVWIDERVSQVVWRRGIQKPPKAIKVKVVRFEDELIEVSLPEE
jgi:large subunit ribosomal protein L31e